MKFASKTITKHRVEITRSDIMLMFKKLAYQFPDYAQIAYPWTKDDRDNCLDDGEQTLTLIWSEERETGPLDVVHKDKEEGS